MERLKQEKAKKRKLKFRSYTSKTKAHWLDFYCTHQSNLSQTNKKVISNLRTPRSRPENVSIKKILTCECFVKNSLFDSLFIMNLVFFLRIFCVF